MRKTNFPLLRTAVAGLLVFALLPGATGCRGPDVTEAPIGEPDRRHEQILTGPSEARPHFGRDAAGFLSSDRLPELATQLQSAARQFGFFAAQVQPDAETSQTFLVVAPDQASAEMLNGFFFWLDDPDAPQAGLPRLVLSVVRLFGEQNRLAALANGQFSDKRVVGLLDQSLIGLLGPKHSPDILAFILACYRREFASRLAGIEPVKQNWQQIFDGIEVTYESAIFSTVSFRFLRDET